MTEINEGGASASPSDLPRDNAWGEPDNPFPHRQGIVYEKDEPQKVVLYDHHGKPLTHAKRKIGFQPPKERQP